MTGSFIQSALGGLSGCLAALLLLAFFPLEQWLGLDELSPMPVNTTIIAAGFVVTVVSGTLAGVVSAAVSLRLKPAEILRTL